MKSRGTVVVTGAAGFIGHHLVISNSRDTGSVGPILSTRSSPK